MTDMTLPGNRFDIWPYPHNLTMAQLDLTMGIKALIDELKDD